MTLTRWSPVRDLAAVEIDRLNRMFEAAFSGEPLASGAWVPRDRRVRDDRKRRHREGRFAGHEARGHQGDVREQRPLDRRRAQVRRTIRRARSITTAWSVATERSVAASRCRPTVDPNRVEATYQDGVLTVKLPRREESRPRQIQVNG